MSDEESKGPQQSGASLCIYHGNCADGFTAAWVFSKHFPEADFHAGFYQTDPPDCTGRRVVMMDFSYKRPVLLKMAEVARSIVIIDHHKSAEMDLVDLPKNVQTIFDMNRSGARMVWDFFDNEGDDPPLLVKHVEDRDLWRFNLKNTKAFQANLFSYEYTFENWDKINQICQDVNTYDQFIKEGEAITRKHDKDIRELISVAATREIICGYNVPVLNAPYFYSSEAGHIMAKNEPFAACYWQSKNEREYSLRSEEGGIDVSEVAKTFGGGGHKHAAGFRVNVGAASLSGHGAFR